MPWLNIVWSAAAISAACWLGWAAYYDESYLWSDPAIARRLMRQHLALIAATIVFTAIGIVGSRLTVPA